MSASTTAKAKTLTIIYNGDERHIPYEPDNSVLATREQAMDVYGITNNRHLLALFTESGEELIDEQQSLKHAHVKKGDELTLGQSKVRGG